MKQRKKKPVPPPPPMVVDEDKMEKMKEEAEKEQEMPEMRTPMFDSEDPEYLRRHDLAQKLQLQSAREGFVLLKNTGILPLEGDKVRINVFGRKASVAFSQEVASKFGVELNQELLNYYAGYKTKDPGYTGSGWDEEKGEYAPQCRTATGMFGGMGYLDHEPFIGYDVYNQDGTLRVCHVPEKLLENAKAFSDTAAVVLYRHGGEGADHEKGDENLSEGEVSMLSFCTENFDKVLVILATNSVIDGDFLVEDREYKFYQYTYGGGVYSNNIGKEVQVDFESRVELRYVDGDGKPQPHVYPVKAEKLGGVFYTCNSLGDRGPEALMELILGRENPSGRLMDEIVYDYDDNPVNGGYGALVFDRKSTGQDLYIYGHNYVAYKEGVYLGYKYFETFCPEKVVYPFGFGLSYTDFQWEMGQLSTGKNQYGELQFSLPVTVKNVGSRPGKDVVELYVKAPYYENGKYHLEKPLMVLCAFEKTNTILPGQTDTVTLTWNARDIACYSDVAECYVLEQGSYEFLVSTNAGTAHSAPAGVAVWNLGEDMLFTQDEVTGQKYRNLFTGSEEKGWRFDARGTEKEHIVYLHRTDVNGVPTVAAGTYPEVQKVDPVTRETPQVLDLETRGLESYYEMDGTDVHLYENDIPVPKTNAVYRDAKGNQKNFMLQDVYRFLKDENHPWYHNVSALRQETGIEAACWDKAVEEQVWDHFLSQLSVNEMLCRFYHCGFDIPALKEYGIPVAYSADTPGQIGTNNKMLMGRTTRYCDSILACTFNKELCYQLGLALGREAGASGENGTSFFYAPGSNLHRSCLSGKNNNYYSEDAYLSGWICGHFVKGLQEGGVNCCLKHFACNDQEMSREGLVVFANEQTLRENYLAAFEHAIKIGNGKGIMTSLGRVGTVNACGNGNLTVELLRKEWGFDGMVITDGYGVTSYMYEINDMLGANSGLLCFGNSGNFGECRDYMELYRYYLQYPGRTTAALKNFMKGCMNAMLYSHTFLDLYREYNYYDSPEREETTDISWFEGTIGLGYEYHQAETLTYLGIKLKEGEENPPAMMPNTNCKDRGGTIRLDDYGLRKLDLRARAGETIQIPVSIEKSYGLSEMAFTLCFDRNVFAFLGVTGENSILGQDYTLSGVETPRGAEVTLKTRGDVFSVPCGKLFDLQLQVKPEAKAGVYALGLLPRLEENGTAVPSFFDKQGHEVSVALLQEQENKTLTGGWSGVYQSVDSGEWWDDQTLAARDDELADISLLSGVLTVQ